MYLAVWAYQLPQLMEASSRTCNKCRSGARQPGDSWCLACAALESIVADLKRGWSSAAIRVIAEDTCVAAARAVRALRFAGNRLGADAPAPSRRAPAPDEVSEVEEYEVEDCEPPSRRSAEPTTAAKSKGKRPRSPVRPRPKTPPRPPPGHRHRERVERVEDERFEEEHHEKRKKHRGGSKHQQHTRRQDDGQARVTHHPLGRELYERQAAPRPSDEP